MKHRTAMEIQEEFVHLFKALKKSKKKGMSFTEMLKTIFLYQEALYPWPETRLDLSAFGQMDRGLLSVHLKNFFKNGIIKCKDGRYRLAGYLPNNG